MRTTLTMGLSLAMFFLMTNIVSAQNEPTGNQPPDNAGFANEQPYTMYSSVPRVAGIKTLIDFNDYDDIIESARGYVNIRYLAEGGDIVGVPDHENSAHRTGSETGMPVTGFVLDPRNTDGVQEPDMHLMRQLTRVGKLFITPDPARLGDAYASVVNPDFAADVDYANLPKDRFGGIVYTLSEDDVMLDRWLVELNSSANTIPNRRNSYAKTVTNFAGTQEFLGVRVRFPNHSHNAHARVAPAYPMPAFDARGYPINYGFFDPQAQDENNPFAGLEEGTAPLHFDVDADREALEDLAGNPSMSSAISYNGVLHNVMEIREIAVRVAGRNYRNGIAIRLRDQNHEVSEYFLGYTDFIGWRTLRWVNPNYLPADEMEPFRLPLYPTEVPYIAFDSFIVYRGGAELGGDYVTYFDNVRVDYDLAVPATQLNINQPLFVDIDDDSWWHILRDRNQAEVRLMMREFSRQVDLRRQNLGRTTRHSEAEAPVEGSNYESVRVYVTETMGGGNTE